MGSQYKYKNDELLQLIPNAPGQSFTVEEAVKGLKEVRDLYHQDERHHRQNEKTLACSCPGLHFPAPLPSP